MRCCFCGKLMKDRGNNPYPIVNTKGILPGCCDYCDKNIVWKVREEINNKQKTYDKRLSKI